MRFGYALSAIMLHPSRTVHVHTSTASITVTMPCTALIRPTGTFAFHLPIPIRSAFHYCQLKRRSMLRRMMCGSRCCCWRSASAACACAMSEPSAVRCARYQTDNRTFVSSMCRKPCFLSCDIQPQGHPLHIYSSTSPIAR